MGKVKLGQNFLKDKKIIEKIIESIDLKPPANILEIGSGKGEITFPLIEKGYNLIAIEKDKSFEKYYKNKNLKIFFEDALKFPENIEEFLKINKIDVLISNLPYDVGKKIYLRFLPHINLLKQMVLMFQREVGEKILGIGGSNILSVISNILSEIKIISYVPPEAFKPKPEVRSILLSFKFKENLGVPFENFLVFLKKCFKHPRKTFYNNLINFYDEKILFELFKDFNLNKKIRAEEIESKTFLYIFKKIEGLKICNSGMGYF